MKRKNIPVTESIRNLNDIEKADNENEILIRSDVHYHFHYLGFDERKKKLDDFKINCYYCDKKIDKQICYVVFDSMFCSIHCQRAWVKMRPVRT